MAPPSRPPASPARQTVLYTRLGFDRVESIDVSDFEGCSQIVDLNTPGVPSHLRGQFNAVYNGGTLEHIFDTRAALRNVFELLTVDGIVIHVGPANGWLEHGFYQFSPTLFVDYYVANRFDVLEALLIQVLDDQPGMAVVHPYVPDGVADARAFHGRWLFYMTCRKSAASTWDAIPQQRYYTSLYGDAADSPTPRLRYMPPYQLQHGVPVVPRPLHALAAPTRTEGFEWIVHVPESAGGSDGMGRCSSRLMLFEDGVAIGPPHSPHAAIRTLGAGRYSIGTNGSGFRPRATMTPVDMRTPIRSRRSRL